MLIASIPSKFNIPFANAAGGGFTRPIPQASQIGIQAGAASLTDGFPPVTFLPIGAGGTPPWGADFNGILNQITKWNQWAQAGAPVAYDGTFQTAIGGYPLGALVPSATSAGQYWLSTVDGNTTNPDTGGAGWQPISFLGGTQTTGDSKWRPTQETLAGWVKANGGTIGDASSGASLLADPSAAALYSWFWTNFSNTQCPVGGGRGGSAAADFAAHKTLAVLSMRGMAPIGMDTMGGTPTTLLSGVPVTSGSATQPGSVLGENFHALITAELAVHAHNITDPTHNHTHTDPTHNHTLHDPSHNHSYSVFTNVANTVPGGGGNAQMSNTIQPGFTTANANTGITLDAAATGVTNNAASTGITIQNAGSGTGHNNVALSMTGTWYWKL